jgi:hypothetical protein
MSRIKVVDLADGFELVMNLAETPDATVKSGAIRDGCTPQIKWPVK